MKIFWGFLMSIAEQILSLPIVCHNNKEISYIRPKAAFYRSSPNCPASNYLQSVVTFVCVCVLMIRGLDECTIRFAFIVALLGTMSPKMF